MPHQAFTIPITDVVDILGLERNPRDRAGASSFNVRCPFCDPPGKHYHMNINTEMNVYFCPRCMDTYTQKNTGALDLYGQVRLGTPLIPGVNGKYIYHTLMCELESKTPNYNSVRSIPVEVEEIYPAANSDLDKVYRALLSLPSLALTRRHGSNLVCLKENLLLSAICIIRLNQFPIILSCGPRGIVRGGRMPLPNQRT